MIAQHGKKRAANTNARDGHNRDQHLRTKNAARDSSALLTRFPVLCNFACRGQIKTELYGEYDEIAERRNEGDRPPSCRLQYARQIGNAYQRQQLPADLNAIERQRIVNQIVPE